MFVRLCLAIQASTYGVGLVSIEETERTADFLMSKPVSRAQVLNNKLLAVLTSLTITNLVVWVSSTISITLFHGKHEYETGTLLLVLFSILIFQLFFLSVGLVISLLVKRVRSVTPYSLALGFGSYILSAFSGVLREVALEYLTPFKHIDVAAIVKNGAYDMPLLLLNITVTVISLADPKVVVEYARAVGDRENLHNLYLVTFADIRASSKAGWTEWKGQLLHELYERTAEFLESGEDDPQRALEQIEQRVQARRAGAQAELAALGVGSEKIDAYFADMPQRYFTAHTPRQIARHALVVMAFERGKLMTTAVREMRGGFSEFIFCARDVHGLYADVAGSLAAAGINILGSNVYTTKSGLALELYRVTEGGAISGTIGPMSAVLFLSGNVDLMPTDAPVNLRVTGEGDGTVSLAWDAAPGAKGYNLYYSYVSGGGWVRINAMPMAGTEYDHAGLENGRTYYYVVTALDAVGNESDPSDQVSAMPHLLIAGLTCNGRPP